jgi:large subunit ribosomal protein L25
MEKIVINAVKRTVVGKQVGVLRRAGKLPGVIYGNKVEPISITMDLKQSTHILNNATTSSIIQIDLEGVEYATIVRERQKDYLKNRFIHIDFQAVSQTEKIKAEVGIEFVGIAPAIKDFSGVIVEGITSIEVEALPKDLPERFIVDISTLAEIGNAIYVRDLSIPSNVDVLSTLEDMIVMVSAPAAEEIEVVETEELAEEPEVIEKGKKEEEEETPE